jgi:hypothetical protein
MNAYRFAHLPSNDSIASSVTTLVAGWFLVAAGAILADPASPYTQRPVAAPVAEAVPAASHATQLAAAPEAHMTITVSARRAAAASQATYSL